ncbi:MAG: WYL domain-containing protein [Flavobacteriaceae bacterium]|nr:WYL domain-containing protein [Flavobacteriaceae bacterium]
MSIREYTGRHHLIVNLLRNRPATFREIADYLSEISLDQGYDFNISNRTFRRDIKQIASLYHIEITYNFSAKVYQITYEDPQYIASRMLEAFDIFHALNISDHLPKQIQFDNKQPKGTKILYDMLLAVRKKQQIRFSYFKYYDGAHSQRLVHPYGVKEFKNRWYVLAEEKDKIKIFAMDRISDMQTTAQHFDMPETFHMHHYFQYCFGIIHPEKEDPKDVTLSFTAFQGKYIKSLPLHSSQQILKDNKEELRIKLRLNITHDFKMEILSYGDQVRVLQPASLKQELKDILLRALKNYD